MLRIPALVTIGVVFLLACCLSTDAANKQLDNDLAWFDKMVASLDEEARRAGLFNPGGTLKSPVLGNQATNDSSSGDTRGPQTSSNTGGRVPATITFALPPVSKRTGNGMPFPGGANGRW